MNGPQPMTNYSVCKAINFKSSTFFKERKQQDLGKRDFKDNVILRTYECYSNVK